MSLIGSKTGNEILEKELQSKEKNLDRLNRNLTKEFLFLVDGEMKNLRISKHIWRDLHLRRNAMAV